MQNTMNSMMSLVIESVSYKVIREVKAWKIRLVWYKTRSIHLEGTDQDIFNLPALLEEWLKHHLLHDLTKSENRKEGFSLNWNEKIAVEYGIRCVNPSQISAIFETLTSHVNQ